MSLSIDKKMKTFYKKSSNLSNMLNIKQLNSEVNETFYKVEDGIDESYAFNDNVLQPNNNFQKRTNSQNYISYNSRKPFENFYFENNN